MILNLKLLREKHGITQQKLASAVGVSQQSINKYENHNIEPDIRTLVAIADYFHTSVDYLIGHIYETDESHSSVRLSSDELKLINGFRYLTPKQQESILLVLDNYRKP